MGCAHGRKCLLLQLQPPAAIPTSENGNPVLVTCFAKEVPEHKALCFAPVNISLRMGIPHTVSGIPAQIAKQSMQSQASLEQHLDIPDMTAKPKNNRQ